MQVPGERMKHTRRSTRYFLAGAVSSLVLTGALVLLWMGLQASAQEPSVPPSRAGSGSLLEGYRHVEVASVSDAAEQILGRKMYMSHRMQSIFPAKFAGFAVTVLLKKDEGNKDPNALAGMMAAIDGVRKTLFM